MKRRGGFAKLLWIILRKDWTEYWKSILIVTAMLVAAGTAPPGLASPLNVGILVTAAYLYGQFCFDNERNRETLGLLLDLPLTPLELILAKYVTMYTMVVFTMTVPAMFSHDWTALLVTNARALFLATLFLTSTIVTDGPLGPQFVLFFLILTTYPMNYPPIRNWMNGHIIELALVGLVITPIIAIASAFVFAERRRRAPLSLIYG